jgi:ERCC4-type nuclease
MTKMVTDTGSNIKTKAAPKTKPKSKTNTVVCPPTKNSIVKTAPAPAPVPAPVPATINPSKTVRLIVDERETDVYNHLCSLLAEKTDATRLTFLELSKKVLPLGDFIIEYTIPSMANTVDSVTMVSTTTQPDGSTTTTYASTTTTDAPTTTTDAPTTTTDALPTTGSMIIERKSLSDLMASIRDGRYDEQSYRLTHSTSLPTLHNVVYIIEGVLTQLKRASDRALVHSTMTSLNHFKGFSVLRTASTLETAEYLLTAAGKIQRNLQERKMPWYVTSPPSPQPNPETDHLGEGATNTAPHYCTVVKKVKKENITPQNIAEIMLCQLPGISSTTAMAIVAEFPTMKHLLDALVADPSCLNGIRTVSSGKSRRMSQSSIDKVKWCLLGTVS